MHPVARPQFTRRAVLTLFAGALALPASAAGSAAYNTKVKFRQGQALAFPDFDLVYKGARKVSSPKYPRGFIFHDFEVSRGTVSRTVSWSSGTGDIGPADFTFGGRAFLLELSHSDKLGRLAGDELVVRPA